MWVNKATFDAAQQREILMQKEVWHQRGLADRLTLENARLRADLDWFKHRLNQVERERGQLIQAAIGVKVAVPEFVPTFEDPATALHEMPNLSTIGGDALPDTTVDPNVEPGEGVDYSLMPGYTGRR
jgi:hypothetical protein